VLTALEERRERFQRARATITDRERTAFVFVIVPERLPILETERAVAALDKYGIPVGGVFVNRVIPESADGTFLQRRRERESGYLKEIERAFAHRALYRLPLFESDVLGVEGLQRIIAELPESERSG
jgi:arsenite-transporting ATPase